MLRRLLALGGLIALLAAPAIAPAQPAGAPPASAATAYLPNDYAKKATWLCWPGRAPDACAVDLTTTVVQADGKTSAEAYKAAANPPVDCFYVYPTISRDPGVVSSMAIGAEERSVVLHQLARFGARCRIFAPMYRQFTLTALNSAMMGKPLPGSADPAARDVGYNDVKAAWNWYLANEDHGRGVVLIGHSQGSGVLTHLIKEEIDGKPVQARLVSAILMGTSLMVPKGADVGGDFKSIPLCRANSQTGCVIAFASFRDNAPPPANSRFGRPRTPQPGMAAACVNPANLAGGKGELHAYLGSGATMIAEAAAPPRAWATGVTVKTPFVSVPGLLSAQCASTDDFNYLAIHVNADPADPRTDDIPGDIVIGTTTLKDWGLHLIDANLTMGNLVDIVGDESKAWAAKGK